MLPILEEDWLRVGEVIRRTTPSRGTGQDMIEISGDSGRDNLDLDTYIQKAEEQYGDAGRLIAEDSPMWAESRDPDRPRRFMSWLDDHKVVTQGQLALGPLAGLEEILPFPTRGEEHFALHLPPQEHGELRLWIQHSHSVFIHESGGLSCSWDDQPMAAAQMGDTSGDAYAVSNLVLKVLMASGTSDFAVFPIVEPDRTEASILRFGWGELSLVALRWNIEP